MKYEVMEDVIVEETINDINPALACQTVLIPAGTIIELEKRRE